MRLTGHRPGATGRTFQILLATLVLATAAPSLADQTRFQVELVGTRVTAKTHAVDGVNATRPFGKNPGATAVLRVQGQKNKSGIIAFYPTESRLSRSLGNKGTSFIKRTSFGGLPKIHQSGEYALVEIDVETPMPDKTQTIDVSGNVSMAIATGQERFRSDVTRVENGNQMRVGPLSLIIDDIKQGAHTDISVRTTEHLNVIKKVRFYDRKGRRLKSKQKQSNWDNTDDATFISDRRYRIQDFEGSKFMIELVLWTGLRTVSIPFDITLNVGME